MAVTIPKDFTRWDGGPNPVPGKRVKVMYGDGAISIAERSEWFSGEYDGTDYWLHSLGAAPKCTIIAYKVTP